MRGALAISAVITSGAIAQNVPEDFPKFTVPGHEQQMVLLQDLYWQHYPGSAPKATLWDIWLPRPSLWPSYNAGSMRKEWSSTLSNRRFDAEGYVVTNQHASIAHQDGWPFPFWNQGRKGFGWHFSFHNTVGPDWRPPWLAKQDDWVLQGVADDGIGELGWNVELTSAGAMVVAPKQAALSHEAPFVQLRWAAEGLTDAQPYIEWTTPTEPAFSHERRMYFDAVATTPTVSYVMIPVYKHRKWNGDISQLRIGFGNAQPGARVCIQALFAQYDTRHNVNNQSYIHGCCEYFWWTKDLSFLRANINRMRLALRYLMTEHGALEENVIHTKWIGHDGSSGVTLVPNAEKIVSTGVGVGNNYWDLLPFGGRDAYATILYYAAAARLAQLEQEIAAHPGWNIPGGPLKLGAEELYEHARKVKETGNKLFWNESTGRFAAGLKPDGEKPDYGLTFLNLEGIHYGFATDEHAKTIMEWINGTRAVAGDTAVTTDIYRWRFGPRATTRRNLEYYHWAWHQPELIPWGGQVQDGGAVLGFSYHDLMARVMVLGPDNAWQRLKEITAWYDEVKKAGGYRKYYDGSREGTMQGNNVAGGLGMDNEFYESVLLPQVMLDGFLGFHPTGSGFRIHPRLPKEWPGLTIDRIHFRDQVLSATVTAHEIAVAREGRSPDEPWVIELSDEKWEAAGDVTPTSISSNKFTVYWRENNVLRFRRKTPQISRSEVKAMQMAAGEKVR